WENQNTNNIYKTNLFDAVEEPGHAQDAEGKTSLEGDNQKWSLNEGKNNIILNAHYFRKYYYINPEVRENGSIDQVGYLIINSEDVIENDPDVTNEYEGTYLAIALKEKETDTEYKMHYYIIKDKNVDYTDDFSLSKITIDGIKVKYDGTELKECKNNDTNNIKIYSGCTLTVNVFDQSKDPDGMASEKFDTMIGHKYKDGSMLDNSTDEYDNTIEFVKDGVEIGENVDPLGEYFGYINGESTTFTFNFEKIVYNLKIKIDNNNAGQFTVQTPVDGIQTLRNVQVNNLKVGDTIRLTYKASLGYDLQEGALRFEIDGVVNDFSYTLVSREVIGGYITQEFVFDFDGTWLRENYYCKDSSTGNVKFYLTDRKSGDSADGVDLGLITIKTELIDFDYKIKLLNTLGESVGEINGFGLESEKWQVTDETLVISNAVVPDGNGNHVVEYDSKNYAMIESYFEEYMGGKNLFHEVYKFPLESYSEVQYKVAENLKFIYSFDTTIISTNVRTIYSVIVVEPIYTLTLRLDSTDNIVMTMSNNSNNLEVYPTNTVTYENRDGVGTGDVTLQTYRGLENSITSSFDIILFDKIYYSVDDTHTGYVPGQTFNFSVESDTEIVATLNKAYHKYNIRYFVNGEEVGSRPNDLLKDANPSDLIVYNNILPDGSFAHTTAPDGYVVLRDIIKPMYKLETDKYILTIEIGDRTYYVDSATGYVETIEIIREHLNSSYKFDIKVCLTEISNDTIRISLKLADNDQNRDGSGYYDDYGTFKVYVDNLAPVSSDVNSRGKLIKAYSRKILKVELNLTKGYRYTGKVQINSNANNPETRAINSNIIILEEEFDTTKGIRDYYILIEKEELDFVFVDSDERNYRFDNINSTNDDRTIVGDQIKLSQSAESNTEEFGYYYIKKGEDKIVISDNENTTFRISPDMIYDGKVTVCVATIKYYAVYIEMTNDSIDRLKVNYVGEGANQKGYRDFTATAGDTDVALNTLVYVPEGDLNISMSAKAQEKYTYWYKIGNGVENQIAEVSGIASTTIEINNDMVIVLNIRPVEFTDIDVTEYHDDQEVVNDENKISNAIANSYAFDTEAEIELVYINEEFIMTTLKITGNEVDDTIVYIDRVKGISIDGETYDYSVNVNGYNIEFYTDNYGVQKIKISYLIADSIGLEVYYTSLIEIKPY
ncbi:MAG: hypothetical protein IKA36_01925, partial [Clostridia bacterium]|nr:hypothetical protein [Clostridia bacterium]